MSARQVIFQKRALILLGMVCIGVGMLTWMSDNILSESRAWFTIFSSGLAIAATGFCINLASSFWVDRPNEDWVRSISWSQHEKVITGTVKISKESPGFFNVAFRMVLDCDNDGLFESVPQTKCPLFVEPYKDSFVIQTTLPDRAKPESVFQIEISSDSKWNGRHMLFTREWKLSEILINGNDVKMAIPI